MVNLSLFDYDKLEPSSDGLAWQKGVANVSKINPVNIPDPGDVLIWTGDRSMWMSLQEALRRYGGDPVKKGKIAEDAVTPSFIADDAITS